jgi:hypothetical protein
VLVAEGVHQMVVDAAGDGHAVRPAVGDEDAWHGRESRYSDNKSLFCSVYRSIKPAWESMGCSENSNRHSAVSGQPNAKQTCSIAK